MTVQVSIPRRVINGYAYRGLANGLVKIEGQAPMTKGDAAKFFASVQPELGANDGDHSWTPEEIERDRLDMESLDNIISLDVDI